MKKIANCTCRKCGKEFEHEFEMFGKGNDRKLTERVKWAEDGGISLCPECYEIEQQELAEKEKKAEIERYENRNQSNPINNIVPAKLIKGSEKQIAWAERIRETFVNLMTIKEDGNSYYATQYQEWVQDTKDKLPEYWVEEGEKDAQELVRKIEYIAQIDDAKWWIDHRGFAFVSDVSYTFYNICSDPSIRAEFDAWCEEQDMPEDIKEEFAEKERVERERSLMVPEDAKSSTQVTVTFDGNHVYTESDKDMDLIGLLKSMEFRWDTKRWVKSIPTAVADINDATAEIINKLLNAGYPVICLDEGVREKAISGNYNPIPTRYITYCPTTDTIDIHWAERSDTIYNAARAIKGSKWKRPVVEVKAERYQEIEGFAALYGFIISPGAREAMNKAKAERLASTVEIAKSKDYKPAEFDGKEILERPAEVMAKHVLEG